MIAIFDAVYFTRNHTCYTWQSRSTDNVAETVGAVQYRHHTDNVAETGGTVQYRHHTACTRCTSVPMIHAFRFVSAGKRFKSFKIELQKFQIKSNLKSGRDLSNRICVVQMNLYIITLVCEAARYTRQFSVSYSGASWWRLYPS